MDKPEATPRPWKWHLRSIDQEHNGAVYSEKYPGHAYAIAMQPRYASDEHWRANAELIVRAVNAHDALVEALEDCVAFLTGHISGNSQRLGILSDACAALRVARSSREPA